jgi:hypothetical protein
LEGPEKREVGQVLRVVTEVEVCCPCRQLRQLGLDPGVYIGFVVHMGRNMLSVEFTFSAGRRRPDVVLNCGELRCSGTSKLHTLFLLESTRLIRGFATEEVLPPIRHGEHGINALRDAR